jgi:hypothetical protein
MIFLKLLTLLIRFYVYKQNYLLISEDIYDIYIKYIELKKSNSNLIKSELKKPFKTKFSEKFDF